jgi:hypothetical protein
MHSSENKIGWKLVIENGPFSFYQYCELMNVSAKFLGCQKGNASLKITDPWNG